MLINSLEECSMFQLLKGRNNAMSTSLSGHLLSMEPTVMNTLEYIKVNFPSFTEHGIQHSYRITEYVFHILSEEMQQSLSDIEVFCFIMASFFHDMGMTLNNVDDKNKQRENHHLYAKEPVKKYFDMHMKSIRENKRICKCVSFVCEAHGRNADELYADEDFKKEDSIQGQSLRYGLLAILLRIGDLMDMEEGRTNEFNMHLNRSYYDDAVSIEHHERHLEIETYNHKCDMIFISIKTKNRIRYKIWDVWLKYLDDEIMRANTHYLSSINSRQIGYYRFPEVIKTITPDKGADFLVEEIRFQVDDKGALWDIFTKSIYTHEFDYVRELIQNAIDATLLKYYVDEDFKIECVSPTGWEVHDKVTILYSQKEGILVVNDCGIGMNETEIRNYLFKAADSGYKHKQKRERFSFPSIAKFGIGFVACLTKASEIEIITQAKNNDQIRAEIQEKSTIAFIERREEKDSVGTIVKLHVKNRFTFKELYQYLEETFGYPSVELVLVDLDAIYMGEKEGKVHNFKEMSCMDLLEIVKHVDKLKEEREQKLLPYKRDEKLLENIESILSQDNYIDCIKMILLGVIEDSTVKMKMEEVLETESGENLYQIIEELREENEEFYAQNPSAIIEISDKHLPNITEYEILNVEIDLSFDVKKMLHISSKEAVKNSGILYIRTKINDPKLGIEWQSINSFLYNSREISKNILKISRENDEEFEDDNPIISLYEIGDASYMMDLLYEEDDDEEYYRQVYDYKDEYLSCYDRNLEYHYDAILMKDNDYFYMVNVSQDRIEEFMMDKETNCEMRLFQAIPLPEDYDKEKYIIEESKLFQDGIKMQFNPQRLVPLGNGWSICNLTADARFDLNVSRHEINLDRSVIDAWLDTYGILIQKKVAENCLRVFDEMNMSYSIQNIMVPRKSEEYFSRRCYDNMKKVLMQLQHERT